MRTTILQQVLVAMGLLAFITDSAILRPYRRYASLQIPDDLREDSEDELDDERKPWRNHGGDDKDKFYKPPPISGTFRPNPRRCCQVGERVAQKDMSCDITVLAMLRKYHNTLWKNSQLNWTPSSSNSRSRLSKAKARSRSRAWHGYNYQYHYQSRLSEKVAKCSAVQPRQFIRCCRAEGAFFTSWKRCQEAAASRGERRRCRNAFIRRKQKQHILDLYY